MMHQLQNRDPDVTKCFAHNLTSGQHWKLYTKRIAAERHAVRRIHEMNAAPASSCINADCGRAPRRQSSPRTYKLTTAAVFITRSQRVRLFSPVIYGTGEGHYSYLVSTRCKTSSVCLQSHTPVAGVLLAFWTRLSAEA